MIAGFKTDDAEGTMWLHPVSSRVSTRHPPQICSMGGVEEEWTIHRTDNSVSLPGKLRRGHGNMFGLRCHWRMNAISFGRQRTNGTPSQPTARNQPAPRTFRQRASWKMGSSRSRRHVEVDHGIRSVAWERAKSFLLSLPTYFSRRVRA